MVKFLLAAFLLTASAMAHAALPVGTFGHEFTSTKDAPVWSVQPGAGEYKVLSHADGKKKTAHVFTNAERRVFWTKMDWARDSHQDSECIGGATELFCFVSAKTRLSIPTLQSQTSDFFHFDTVGGIMENRKIGAEAPR